MPLKPGKAAISENIAKLRHEGKPPKQAVAIAHSVAGKGKKRTLKTLMKP